MFFQVLIKKSNEKFKCVHSEAVTNDELSIIEKKIKISDYNNINRKCYGFFRDGNNSYMFKVEPLNGELLVHIIIKRDGYFDKYPIQYINSPQFDIDYNCEENIRRVLDEFETSNEVSLDNIKEFIMRRPKTNYKEARITSLKSLINSFIESKDKGNTVALRDRNDNPIMWIFAISYLFPVKLAHDISFVTYSDNINTEFDIICMEEASQLTLELYIDADERFAVADFIEGIVTKVKSEVRYANLAQIGYSISYDNLEVIVEFMEKFDYDVINREVDLCYELYNLIYTEMSIVDNQLVRDGIDFLANYAKREYICSLVDILENKLKLNVNYIDMDIAFAYTNLLVRMAKQVDMDIFVNEYVKFVGRYFNSLIFDRSFIKLEEIINVSDTMVSVLKASNIDISHHIQSNENFIKIRETTGLEDNRNIRFYENLVAKL